MHTLPVAELLGLLFRTGSRDRSPTAVAHDLLRDGGGIDGLPRADRLMLRRAGLSDAKSTIVLAAVELGRRLAQAELPARDIVNQPEPLARYLALRYNGCQEVLGALFLNVRGCVIGEQEIYRGTATRVSAAPNEILRQTLLHNATSLILFHTHPSGDPEPSEMDVHFTRMMSQASRTVGIELLDHLVLGSTGLWRSLRRFCRL